MSRESVAEQIACGPDRNATSRVHLDLGCHLAQWLLTRGETALDVPATATARLRELSRGRRKIDTLDAAAAASVAALHGGCPTGVG